MSSTSSAPSSLLEADAAARDAHIDAARRDVRAFATFVLKAESDGSPIRLSGMHLAWLKLADDHARIVIHAPVSHGKSQLLVIARTLFLLGRDPNRRILILSSTHGQASKLVRQLASYIETSPELHSVFPRLVRGKESKAVWRDDALTVQRSSRAKEASITATGKNGAILGGRFTDVLVDDLVDYESSRTEGARSDLLNWFTSTVESRLEPGTGRILLIGTPWNLEDLPHTLARTRGWPMYKFSAWNEDGSPSWPERFSSDALRDMATRLGVFDASRMLACEPLDDESALIKRDWIDLALVNGAGMTVMPSFFAAPPGDHVVVGVDVATSLNVKADESAIVAIQARGDGRRRLLSVEAGRWTALDLADRVVRTSRRLGNARILVESVAAQEHTRQLVAHLGRVEVDAHRTGAGKASLGYLSEQLGAELQQGLWQIPSGADGRTLDPQVARLVTEMGRYRPGDHAGDRLAACLMALVGVRRGAMRAEIGRLNFRR